MGKGFCMVIHGLIFCFCDKSSHWNGVLNNPKIKIWRKKERGFVQLRDKITKNFNSNCIWALGYAT